MNAPQPEKSSPDQKPETPKPVSRIFISYCQKDSLGKDEVSALDQKLTKDGFQVFFDERQEPITTNWKEKID